jgi:SpoVK/Ycf46/Vps4 family AAA+-type ATPase
MTIKTNNPLKLQMGLTSSVELIRASLEPYLPWIEQTLGINIDQTLTLALGSNPGDIVAEQLLKGLPVTANLKARKRSWDKFIQDWALPTGVSPRIAVYIHRERQPKSAPSAVWDLDWNECPIALTLKGLERPVISVQVPVAFPFSDESPFTPAAFEHWFIVCREDAAKLLMMVQEVKQESERCLETAGKQTRFESKYDWNMVVMEPAVRRLVRDDFELFFEREEWFHAHNLPYRRGYLFWGSPGNGKTATIRVMASHPYIKPFAIDLSNNQNESSDVFRLFAAASESTPALIILEDLDRAFPTEGKQTRERKVSFQTLLNCLDGVGSQDGVIVVATANNPTHLDPAILKRPGRFDRVVQFRNPDASLRREYYQRLNPILCGEQFEAAIRKTEGFSFAQLRETYILGAQCAFENGQEVSAADVIEAISLQAAGAEQVKTSAGSSGFVHGRSLLTAAQHEEEVLPEVNQARDEL